MATEKARKRVFTRSRDRLATYNLIKIKAREGYLEKGFNEESSF